MTTPYSLTINNKDIYDFYNTHNINFEHMNLIFIDILKKLMPEMDTTLNSTLAKQLLRTMGTINNKLDALDNELVQTNDHVIISFQKKMDEQKKDYIKQLETILTMNNTQQITPIIQNMNDNMINKTNVLINELIPKNQEVLSKNMENNFTILKTTIANETNNLLKNTLDKTTIELFINNINQTISQANTQLFNIAKETDTKITEQLKNNNDTIKTIQHNVENNNNAQEVINKKVEHVLKVFDTVQGKATSSELVTYNILSSLYPSAEITHVGQIKETGDIIFSQTNKPKILVENKNHETCNVPKIDVEKFIRDCKIQNCSGIMLAQHKGISNKENFEIQIDNSNVLLYLHEVKYNSDKIKMAIEIVENLKVRIDDLYNDKEYKIDKMVLDNMNTDFNNYLTQKNILSNLLKEYSEKFNTAINDLKLPSIDNYLSNYFTQATNNNIKTCKFCGKTVLKSLAQHYRYCTKNKVEIAQKSEGE